MITYVVIDTKTVFLVEIFLKSEHSSADIDVLIQRMKNQGLI